MTDSRLRQWAALLDGMRCEVADMMDEPAPPTWRPALKALRRYLNWAIAAINKLEAL